MHYSVYRDYFISGSFIANVIVQSKSCKTKALKYWSKKVITISLYDCGLIILYTIEDTFDEINVPKLPESGKLKNVVFGIEYFEFNKLHVIM